jgi:hypothetical protein
VRLISLSAMNMTRLRTFYYYKREARALGVALAKRTEKKGGVNE